MTTAHSLLKKDSFESFKQCLKEAWKIVMYAYDKFKYGTKTIEIIIEESIQRIEKRTPIKLDENDMSTWI